MDCVNLPFTSFNHLSSAAAMAAMAPSAPLIGCFLDGCQDLQKCMDWGTKQYLYNIYTIYTHIYI